MRTVTPLDLRRRLGAILDAASAGERFVIERDRRPLAVLVSVEDARRLDPSADDRRKLALAALDRLAELGERLTGSVPGGPSAVEAVRAERDRNDGPPMRGRPSQPSSVEPPRG